MEDVIFVEKENRIGDLSNMTTFTQLHLVEVTRLATYNTYAQNVIGAKEIRNLPKPYNGDLEK